MKIRKALSWREDIHESGGRALDEPARLAVAAVVIQNPWIGAGFVEDLQPVADEVAPQLGRWLAERVVAALDAPVEAYGKAGIVGLDGELEHGSALIHTLKFGNPYRQAANATTLLPAVEKRAPAGTTFDIPLKHVTDQTTRSHHQTIEVTIAAAPAADEIVVALAAASAGRPHARLPEFSSDRG